MRSITHSLDQEGSTARDGRGPNPLKGLPPIHIIHITPAVHRWALDGGVGRPKAPISAPEQPMPPRRAGAHACASRGERSQTARWDIRGGRPMGGAGTVA